MDEDIVVFDPETVRDVGTYLTEMRYVLPRSAFIKGGRDDANF